MQIFVKLLTGRELVIDLPEEITVVQLKEMIKQKENYTVEQQLLLYAGKQLEDQRSLYDYGIQPQSKLFLVMRNRGGSN